MILIDRLLTSGIRFVLNTLVQAAEAEDRDDAQALRDALLRAQMALELGEIGEDEFERIETDVSHRLRAVREREQAQGGPEETRVAGVEVTLHAELERG